MPLDNKRSNNKKANRATIIEAARVCFLELGYDAVTVRDIVRESTLAPGTFYNYFDDKETLFREILEERVVELTAMMQSLRSTAETIDEFVYGAYRGLFEKICEEPCFFELILRNEHAVRGLFRESVVGIPLRALTTDLNDAMSRGLFPELDAEMLAASLYGIGFEIGRLLCDKQGTRDPDQAAHFATKMLTQGIRAFGLTGSRAKLGESIAPGITVVQT